ncbi:MAG: transglycosylase SLT domain-containing protein [Wolinella sp.]
MKAILAILLLASVLLASFKNSTYNDRDESILEIFGVEPSFIYDNNFLDVKNSLLSNIQKDNLLKRYDEAYEFVPMLKEMIIKAEIPQEFLYLAMAESEFSIRAHSSKNATGLWQLIPQTAKILGLRIDEYVDERRDPVRSTEAAIEYLKRLHAKFGKWHLAAIAYNCGDGRLQKAIERAGSDDLGVLLDPDKKYIPLESRHYMRKILSIAMIFRSVDMLKSSDYEHFLNRGAGTTIAKVYVKRGIQLYKIAEDAGISLEEFKRYNRHLKHSITPPGIGNVAVYLPYERLASFRQNYSPDSHKSVEHFAIYNVRQGDTLGLIAKRHGVSVREIQLMNNLEGTVLSLNQVLRIPSFKRHVEVKEYVTKRGDTLDSISERFNISKESIKKLNNLNKNSLNAGVKLVLTR